MNAPGSAFRVPEFRTRTPNPEPLIPLRRLFIFDELFYGEAGAHNLRSQQGRRDFFMVGNDQGGFSGCFRMI